MNMNYPLPRLDLIVLSISGPNPVIMTPETNIQLPIWTNQSSGSIRVLNGFKQVVILLLRGRCH
jgi:hypothetical protein